MTNPVRLSPADYQCIREQKDAGFTWKQIGSQFGLTERQVKERASRLGIRATKVSFRPTQPKVAQRILAQPIPRGVATLPPLPSLLMPLPKIMGS